MVAFREHMQRLILVVPPRAVENFTAKLLWYSPACVHANVKAELTKNTFCDKAGAREYSRKSNGSSSKIQKNNFFISDCYEKRRKTRAYNSSHCYHSSNRLLHISIFHILLATLRSYIFGYRRDAVQMFTNVFECIRYDRMTYECVYIYAHAEHTCTQNAKVKPHLTRFRALFSGQAYHQHNLHNMTK